MRNLLFEIAYRGTNYCGYQVQRNGVSVAEVLQNAIENVVQKREPIVGCSRTDSGVHANQYFFHMLTECKIPCERMVLALNRHLPRDVAVLSCREVPLDFHARYRCIGKEYIYKIWHSPYKNPFEEDLSFHYPYKIDYDKLHAAAQEFVGTHDFRAFCSSGADAESTVRTITAASVEKSGNHLIFTVRGDGFLYNMVRIMVGTLLMVNYGMKPDDSVTKIIESGDRSRAGHTAPAHGLYLNRVFYNEADFYCEK